jgi:hypothetical protein
MGKAAIKERDTIVMSLDVGHLQCKPPRVQHQAKLRVLPANGVEMLPRSRRAVEPDERP